MSLKEQIERYHEWKKEYSLQLEQLQKLASKLDAAVIENSEDHTYALQTRMYDEEGRLQVRYQPDPCCFHTLESLLGKPFTC